MALTKCKLKKNDMVIVTVGKDKGKTGKILEILKSSEKVLVEGINLVKKHLKSENPENKKSRIISKEMPISVSNVMYYSSSTKKGHRVQYDITKGTKVRVLAGTKEEIK